MSQMKDAQTKLVTKLNSVLANKYNIYTEINPAGYDTPFIVLDGFYGIVANDTTTQSKRLSYQFNTLIGLSYSCASTLAEETAKEEELQIDIEKIFGMAVRVKETEVDISDDKNQDDNAKVSVFTLIME